MIYRFIVWLFKREVYNGWKEEKRLLDQEREESQEKFERLVSRLISDEERRYEQYGDWWNYGDKPN